MKKKILIILMFASLIFISNSYANVYDIARPSIVSLISIGAEAGLCTGVVIENTTTESKVLTAKHCTVNADLILIEGHSVSKIYEDANDDLSLLIISHELVGKTAINFSKVEPKEGNKLYILGYPNFIEYIAEGEFFKKGRESDYADITAIPGCSGGGVFNGNGELVGILWGGIDIKDYHILCYEPLRDILKFLESIK